MGDAMSTPARSHGGGVETRVTDLERKLVNKDNNLSDLTDPAAALVNLGALAVANNLSDVASATTARSNLELAWRKLPGSIKLGSNSVDVDFTIPTGVEVFRFTIVGGLTTGDLPVAYFSSNGGTSFFTTAGDYRRSMLIQNGNPAVVSGGIDTALAFAHIGPTMQTTVGVIEGVFYKGSASTKAYLQTRASGFAAAVGNNQGLYTAIAGANALINKLRFSNSAGAGSAWRSGTTFIVEGLEL